MERKSPSFGGATLTCAKCGRETVRTGPRQKYCHECADRIRHPGVGRGKGARLRRGLKDPKRRTLAGLSLVEVDRLAKENHTSYGQIVAGWELEKQKAAGDAAPTT